MNVGGPCEWRCEDYVISDDPERFDADAMHDFLEVEGYWATGRSRDQTAVGAANSVVLGVYGPDGSMVGGARVVTDRATFGWLTDVYVLAEHRGLGLGRAVVAAACEHPAVAGVKRILLRTADAHELYRSLGFEEPPAPERWLELQSAPGDPSGDAAATDSTAGAGDGALGAAFDPATGLRPYVAWQGGGLPDPRTAPVSQIATHLLELVTTEGPVTADRAYRLYIRGAGSSKVTQRARAPMEQALGRLTLRGQVDVDELDNGGEPQQVLRLAGSPPVVVRELGERSLYEVPLTEIAELMVHKRRDLLGRSGSDGLPAHAVADVIKQAAIRRASPERVKRAVLDGYGLIRMTQAADRYLDAALALLDEP
ncbi:MAG: GNAT family N-acetyltransferase [Acidimicrobiaceae bacterium]|nr:GNAT family N-acetyltransferase [Acidimicrobiaceae bacterium]